jgi:hypothetical protein
VSTNSIALLAVLAKFKQFESNNKTLNHSAMASGFSSYKPR